MADLHPSDGRFTVWQLIIAVVGACVVVAGAAWTAGRAYLADELEQYKRTEQWKVPDAIRKIADLSERANITLEERAQLHKALQSAQELRKENDGLQKELSANTSLLNDLQKRLSEIEGDTFELTVGNSRFVIAKQLALGLLDIDNTKYLCGVQLGDKKEALPVGRTIEATHGDQKVRVTLVNVISPSLHNAYRSACRFSIAQ